MYVHFVGWPIYEFKTNTSDSDRYKFLFFLKSKMHGFTCLRKSNFLTTNFHVVDYKLFNSNKYILDVLKHYASDS